MTDLYEKILLDVNTTEHQKIVLKSFLDVIENTDDIKYYYDVLDCDLVLYRTAPQLCVNLIIYESDGFAISRIGSLKSVLIFYTLSDDMLDVVKNFIR
jgi:hypothetical protein